LTANLNFEPASVKLQASKVERSLADFQVNQRGTVVYITNDRIGSKLMAMGIRPGSQLTLVRKAPLGSGFYVKVNSKHFIAVRKQEAACIMLK